MRLIVCVASLVCSVPNTRWPVSVAVSAVFTVSGSRNSPIRIAVRILAQDVLQRDFEDCAVSVPTSIWLMIFCRRRTCTRLGLRR